MQEETTGDGHWFGDGSKGPETDTQSLWPQSLSSKSAPAIATPAGNDNYQSPMQDGWAARMDALLAEREAK